MLIYTLRRLNLLLFTLLALSLLAYWLEVELGTGTPDSLLGGYFAYLDRLFAGDLGISLHTGRPVLEEIRIYFPATLELCLAAVIIAGLVSIPLGTLAALNQGKWLDKIIMSISLVGASIPVYWLGQLLVLLFSLQFRWLPSSGQLNLLYEIEPVTGFQLLDCWLSTSPQRWNAFLDALRHLALPALTLSLLPAAEISRLVRNAMAEVLRQNYIKAAFSRGWSPAYVILHHGVRNALPPMLPQLAMQFGTIMTSAIIIEQVFEWPGIGRWLIASIMNRDYVAIQAGLLLISSLLLLLNIVTELVSTLLYPARRKELYGQQD
ncbi:ABC transporter permease [Pseudaeromonas sharmana]|uniref:ABC transporter permease n=1 Tax=Pseudaeromonas sharmana TaxID=328412 RepID=A0ABV8CPM7_9GAMM